MTTTKRAPKKYYICERDNPQLGIYYIACGMLSKTAAKRKEQAIYGHNTMLPFDTLTEYQEKVAQLRREGHKVQ